MKNDIKIGYVILALGLALVGCDPAQVSGGSTPAAPVAPLCSSDMRANRNLVMIGDSISLGYTNYVIKGLCGEYNADHAHYPKEIADGQAVNARGTTFTIAHIDEWLAEEPAQLDVITWNNGLWNALDPAQDTFHGPNATDDATYEADLITIGNRLKATGARVIFFTTTDVPGTAGLSDRIPGRDLVLNDIAMRVLPPMGIEVHDLNALTRSNPQWHPATDLIHFTDAGYAAIGALIVQKVLGN